MNLKLRPLEKSDFAILHQWLNQSHLYPFYMQEPISPESVSRKFSPRVGKSGKVRSIIATADGRPFGYMQWYFNRAFPDYGAATIGRNEGVSIDYFIGDTNFLGQGLGSKMLNALVLQTYPTLDMQDRSFHIGHDDRNLVAIRCTERAGFAAEKTFFENERRSTLYVKDEARRAC